MISSIFTSYHNIISEYFSDIFAGSSSFITFYQLLPRFVSCAHQSSTIFQPFRSIFQAIFSTFCFPPLCTAPMWHPGTLSPRGQVESLRQQLSTTQQQLLDSEAAAQAASVARDGASAMAPTRVTRVQEKCRKIGSILGCGPRIFCPCCFGGMFTK